jgi:hypothetical protein
VSRFPRERMRDITSDRFALEKTSTISTKSATHTSTTSTVS